MFGFSESYTMSAFTEWTTSTNSSGDSVAAQEQSSDRITGWIEAIRITSLAGVDAGMTGTLSEVDGIEDTIWSGIVGASATLRKYPVHDEVLPDDTDPGSKGKFYLSQQKLKLVLALAVSEVSDAVTIRVKYIPDYR